MPACAGTAGIVTVSWLRRSGTDCAASWRISKHDGMNELGKELHMKNRICSLIFQVFIITINNLFEIIFYFLQQIYRFCCI